MAETLTLYFTSVSSSSKTKGEQKHIMMILDSKKYKYDSIDVSDPGNREEFEKKMTAAGKNGQLAPQLFLGDQYLGDHDAFSQAVEEEDMDKFLQGLLPEQQLKGQ